MRFVIPASYLLLPTTKFTDSHSPPPSPIPNSPFCFSWGINLCQSYNLCRIFSIPNLISPLGRRLRRRSIARNRINNAGVGIGIEIEIQIESSTDRDLVRSIGLTMGVPEIRNGSERNMAMVFTYGTLKRGFSNHALMQELIASRDAVFVGACRTAERLPLVCGPYRVPFLLNKPGAGERVWGELYAVSRKGLVRMDELEGTSRGHYERLPIKIVAEDAAEEDEAVEAEAYFGHRSYAEEMWSRSGERGYAIYSEKEARGYVRRKDRPHNLTFLDHIRIFLASPSTPV